MEHEKTAEALDDLINDIRDLIDDKEEQETPAEEPLAEEEPAAEQSEETAVEEPVKETAETEEEELFQQQRWTERQRVPKHVAKLQQHQDEAYAKWLEEQDGKEPELPPELAEEELTEEQVQTTAPGKKKKPIGLILCLILVVLTVIAAAVVALTVPQQPKLETELARVKGFSTVLLAGTDDSLGRTDMLMLLSMDSDGKAMSLVSLSRDIPVEVAGEVVSLGSVYGRAGGGQEGIAALKTAVSGCVGFVPDGCLVLYPDALTEFVEILGSVQLDVPYDVRTQTVTLRKGSQRMSAQQSYTLMRYSDETVQDLQRMQTQQLFLSALVRQCTDLGGMLKSPALLDCLSQYSVTDMSVRNLLWLARSAMAVKSDRIQAITLPGDYDTEGNYVLDGEAAVQTVNDYSNPHVRAVTAADLRIAEP